MTEWEGGLTIYLYIHWSKLKWDGITKAVARWRVYFGTALRLPEKVAHACHHHSYSIATGSNGDTQRVPPCGEDRRTKILSGNMTYVNLFKCLSSSFQINVIPVKVERILWGLLINTQNP